MKCAALLTSAAVVVALANAQQDSVTSTQQQQQQQQPTLRIGSKDFLNHPTAFINKNAVTSDNNVAITKSNIVFSQNDRLALANKIEELVTTSHEEDAAVLSKSILKAVSLPDTDAALMSKASAVVASKGDPTKLTQSVHNFINAIATPTKDAAESHEYWRYGRWYPGGGYPGGGYPGGGFPGGGYPGGGYPGGGYPGGGYPGGGYPGGGYPGGGWYGMSRGGGYYRGYRGN